MFRATNVLFVRRIFRHGEESNEGRKYRPIQINRLERSRSHRCSRNGLSMLKYRTVQSFQEQRLLAHQTRMNKAGLASSIRTLYAVALPGARRRLARQQFMP